MKNFEDIFDIASKVPGYFHAFAPYIDFEGLRIPHTSDTPDEETTDSVVHITLVAEEGVKPHVYYVFKLSTPTGLVEQAPPADHLDRLKVSVDQTVKALLDAGISLNRVTDETVYPKECKGIYEQSDAFRVCAHCGRPRSVHKFLLEALRCPDSAVTLPNGACRPEGIPESQFDDAKSKRLPDGWTVKKGTGGVNPWQVFDARANPQRFAGPTKTIALINALCSVGTPIK